MTRGEGTDYRELLHDLRLSPAITTPWGIDVLGTAALQTVTAGLPTGYYHSPHHGDVIEWLDPEMGGAALVLHGTRTPIAELTRAPEPVSADEVLCTDEYIVGEAPYYDGYITTSFPRQLGLRVLAHSAVLTAVQLPGIRDYRTAYQGINGRPPDIVVDKALAGEITGMTFLDMVAAGQWPYDIHFFESHAPALVIGGPEYAAAIRGMVRHVHATDPEDETDALGNEVDIYADIIRQGNTAKSRVERYEITGRIDHLYGDQSPPDSVFPRNKAVMRRFNGVLADHLSVTLPASELSDVHIPT